MFSNTHATEAAARPRRLALPGTCRSPQVKKIDPYKGGFRRDGSAGKERDGSVGPGNKSQPKTKFGEPAKLPPGQNVKAVPGKNLPPKPEFKKKPTPAATGSAKAEARPSEEAAQQEEASMSRKSESTIKEHQSTRQSEQPEKPSKKPTTDPTLYKLLDRIKTLTEQHQTAQREKAKLELKLQGLEPPQVLAEESRWPLARDTILKRELLRLSLENYKLRTSLRVNERFGELIISLGKEFKQMIERGMAFTAESCREASNPSELIGDLMSLLIRLDGSLQAVHRDYQMLREEAGSQNAKEWDCGFSKTDIHSQQELVSEVCSVLLDFEGRICEKITRLENKLLLSDYSEGDRLLREALIEESQFLLTKGLLLNNFVAGKATSSEFKKRIKAVSMLNIEDSLTKFERHLRENLSRISGGAVGREEIHSLVLHDSEAIKAKYLESRSSESLVKIGCMLSHLEHLDKSLKNSQDARTVQKRMEYFVQKLRSDFADPTFELFNYLDRMGITHEIYLAYRQRLIYNYNLLLSPSAEGDNLLLYASELLKAALEFFTRQQAIVSI